MTTVPADLHERLEEFLGASDCPGAQLGVLADGDIHVASAGVLNLNTGVEVTDDAVFQIGSVTKVWTATQIMQLVDEGAFTVDTKVQEILPGFTVGNPETAENLTVRHLLSHTSGVEGDVFDDFGTNDDCIEQFVAALAQQGSVHQLDETWSYCNSGWVVLGRIIEVVTKQSWDAALKERLGAPLGLQRLCTLPAEAILHRVAVGHMKPPGADSFVVAPQWMLPRAVGPAGLITTTVHDLLTFGRMHLEEGRNDSGEQVLSPASTALMQQVHAPCPERYLLADSWGLGWMIRDREGHRLIGHGGNTIGQSAYFYLVPDQGVGVALLTNLSGGSLEAKRLLGGLLDEVAGVSLPDLPAPADEPVELDLERFTGTYRRHGVETVVARHNDHLRATVTMSGPLVAAIGAEDPIEIDLLPGPQDGDDRTLFVGRDERLGGQMWVPVTFYGDGPDGRAAFLHTGARVAARAG
jgi:CubicO group peptidase (beta-lactamase class C family)